MLALWGVLALAAVSTGCGRVGFDAVGGDGDGAVGSGLVARTIEISNPSTSTLPAGYAVVLSLAALPASSHRPDLADVHVIGVSGTRLDRVVDHDNTGTVTQLWFATDADIAGSASDSRYTLLYGDPTDATPLQDGTNVFAFYDDFTGSTLQSQWLKQGTPQIAGGELRILAGTTGDGIASMPASDGVPLVASFEIRVQITDPTSAPGTYYYWFGFQSGFTNGTPFTNWVARSASKIHGEHASSMTPCDVPSYCPGPDVAQTTAYRVFRIDRLSDREVFYADGVIAHTVAQAAAVDLALNARNFLQTSDLVIDWIRARPIADPEPVTTLGPERPR